VLALLLEEDRAEEPRERRNKTGQCATPLPATSSRNCGCMFQCAPEKLKSFDCMQYDESGRKHS
jgi:hypothetical protein